jgi:hypothetical protein
MEGIDDSAEIDRDGRHRTRVSYRAAEPHGKRGRGAAKSARAVRGGR